MSQQQVLAYVEEHVKRGMAVEGPDGKIIQFLGEMTKDEVTGVMREVTGVMRRLYPSSSSQISRVELWALSFPVITIVLWLVGTWISAGFKSR
jgi:hypothetical protein